MEESRREFLKTTALLGLASIINLPRAESFVLADNRFQLPPLNYAFNAMEPFIDAQTMEIHHDKHHQAYVTKLNEAIDKEPTLAGKPIEELMQHLSKVPASVSSAVRNQGGGHWNHSFFWQLLRKDAKPGGRLAESIDRDFGSMENFYTAFDKAAMGQFGSGWAWLISNNGKLSITSTPNQDNPLMDIPSIQEKGKPVIGIDVWEHAYYLKYQNKRADYLKAFRSVINWNQAEKNYLAP